MCYVPYTGPGHCQNLVTGLSCVKTIASIPSCIGRVSVKIIKLRKCCAIAQRASFNMGLPRLTGHPLLTADHQ